MRQVPQYLIVGHGRMATHFSAYLKHLQIPYTQWDRQSKTLEKLQQLVNFSSNVLFLIKDDAILSLTQQLSKPQETLFVHFSGCLTVDGIFAAHPLMTFGPTLYDLPTYLKIPFIIDTKGPQLHALLPGLTNPSYAIETQSRAFYHALCVMSANFTTILWKKMFDEFESQFNIPRAAIFPYLNITCQNIMHNAQIALTGPLVRQDTKTIEANLKALEHDPFQSIYLAFYKAYQRNQYERT